MGSESFTDEELRMMAHKLNLYDTISLREQLSTELLKPYLTVPIRTDLDGAFLVGVDEWDKIAVNAYPEIPEKYILVYELVGNSQTIKAVASGTRKVRATGLLRLLAETTSPLWRITSFAMPAPADICRYV